MTSFPRALLVLPLALTGAAHGQKIIDTHYGNLSQLNYGSIIAAAGDINDDGWDDVLVGAPFDDTNGQASGRVDVYSGFDQTLLYVLFGASAGDNFGDAVDGAGDVDNDGFDDILVGAWPAGSAGEAYVFSGQDGSLMYTFQAATPNDRYGSSVAGIGDVNGDNRDDVCVGAYLDNSGSTSLTTGAVWCHSGIDGSLLWVTYGEGHIDHFGHGMDATGDVDGDGVGDVIVRADWDDNNGSASGSAHVLSGADGTRIWVFDGDAAGDNFGFDVGGAGDVNNDGRMDLIVGTDDEDYARVFSGLDGSILYEHTSPESHNLGRAVDGAGDVDGDGFDDYLLGAPTYQSGRGYLLVVSGATGTPMYSLYGGIFPESFGWSAAGLGDVNADGLADFATGAPGNDTFNANGGYARFYSGTPQIGQSYCGPAVANSTGLPAVIEARGSNVAGDNCVTLTAFRIPGAEFGYFIGGMQQGYASPGSSSGNICLQGVIARFNAPEDLFEGPVGSLQVDLTDIPTTPISIVAAGETWNFQCWYRDGNTNNFSDAVSITFQ